MTDFDYPHYIQHPDRITDSLCTRCLHVVRVDDRFATLEDAQRAHICRAEDLPTPKPQPNILRIDHRHKLIPRTGTL